jgi:5-methylcytosine-specific restriction endonuclease McrA
MELAELKQWLGGSVKNGRKVITDLLDERELDTPFQDERIAALLARHPRKPPCHLEYLVMRLGDYGIPVLHFKDRHYPEDDISRNDCIAVIFGKYDEATHHITQVIKALRKATYDRDFRNAFLRENTTGGSAMCAVCKCLCGTGTDLVLHMDHWDIAFSDILDKYISKSKLDLAKIAVKSVGVDTVLCDPALAEDWVAYHNQYANYKILCAPCNLKKGARGPQYVLGSPNKS